MTCPAAASWAMRVLLMPRADVRVLDIPVETVRSRLRHAMRGLRAAIEADERPVPRRTATPEASR